MLTAAAGLEAWGMTDDVLEAALQQGVFQDDEDQLGEARRLSCVGACDDNQDQLGDTCMLSSLENDASRAS